MYHTRADISIKNDAPTFTAGRRVIRPSAETAISVHAIIKVKTPPEPEIIKVKTRPEPEIIKVKTPPEPEIIYKKRIKEAIPPHTDTSLAFVL